MTKDEMKNRISMTLKDPILQQGFEIICKNLAELEEVNADLKQSIDWANERESEDVKRITELEEKISVLLSCKNCPENKGGLLCQKEYEDKCLAQKIQHIKELQEENAELKEKLKPENCLKVLAKNGYVKFSSEQLTKAKELLLELYDCIPASMADLCRETLQKVALFFRDEE